MARRMTDMAYKMWLVRQPTYEWKNLGGAWKLTGKWCAWVKLMRQQTEELLKLMVRASKMIEAHLDEISVHWT